MLINKSMLAGALEVCRPDKDVPMFNCVCIEKDGTIIATNRMVLYVAEPVLPSVIDKVPLPGKQALNRSIVLTADTATEILKMINQDKIFKGLLEHAELKCVEDSGNEIEVLVKDGQHTKSMKMFTISQQFGDWKAVLRETKKDIVSVNKFVYNRKRLDASIAAVKAACHYNGEFAPIFSSYASSGRMLWQALNELTGQSVYLVSQLAEIQSITREESAWERGIFRSKLVLKKR